MTKDAKTRPSNRKLSDLCTILLIKSYWNQPFFDMVLATILFVLSSAVVNCGEDVKQFFWTPLICRQSEKGVQTA